MPRKKILLRVSKELWDELEPFAQADVRNQFICDAIEEKLSRNFAEATVNFAQVLSAAIGPHTFSTKESETK